MLKNIKKAHLIGIKGVGMCALAQILQSKGIKLSGSDVPEEFFTDTVLKELRIPVIENFSPKNIPADADVVITSNAYINSDNPEVNEAKKQNLRLVTYPEAVAELFNKSYGIAVAGTHGKSTTAAMLGVILEYAGLDPTVIVGSRVNEWGSNARVPARPSAEAGGGKAKYFVLEADEYSGAFLKYHPKLIVLCDVDYDHPDIFKSKREYSKIFREFTSRVSANKVVHKISTKNINIPMPGEHNRRNAARAIEAAKRLGVSKTKALENFKGLARRMEPYGKHNGAILYDDYAHHPEELTALFSGLREKYPRKKIICLFQPHTYSRTDALFGDFAKSLNGADKPYILKTYASAREARSTSSGQEGSDKAGKKLARELKTKYFTSHKSAAEIIKKELNRDTVFITAGAGDGWRVHQSLTKSTN